MTEQFLNSMNTSAQYRTLTQQVVHLLYIYMLMMALLLVKLEIESFLGFTAATLCFTQLLSDAVNTVISHLLILLQIPTAEYNVCNKLLTT